MSGTIKHAKYEGKNKAPNAAEQKSQNQDAQLDKASRTRTPGWPENHEQNKLQQAMARGAAQRSDDARSEKAGLKKRTKARSSDKKYQNQK